MRRHWESMNNDKKKSVAIGRALLSGPYLIWMIGFTIIPLALIFWYGITTKNGNLTLANITAIMSPDHWKALWLSLALSGPGISSCHDPSRKRQLCQRLYCIYLHPSYVDELPAAHYGMADIT